MEYAFSWSWFLVGLVIIALGAGLVIWYRPIADNLGSGVSSYDKYKLYGVVACVIGLVVMLNIHTVLLRMLFGAFFHRS